MTRALATLALVACAFGQARAAMAPAAPVTAAAAATREASDWPRIETVLPAAAGGERPIVIEFFKPSCRYCTRLHGEIWGDATVAALLHPLTKSRIDISTPSGGVLAGRLKVDLFPSVLLVDPTGRVLDRLNGLPELGPARAFLERAAARRIAPVADPMQWIEVGDFAAEAGVLTFAVERYRAAMDDPRMHPQHAENTRLKCARTLERLGDRAGAAAVLEPFTAVSEAGGAVRPALDLLIRLRKALGDAEGEKRAKDAFTRLFPTLTAPA